MANKRRTGAGVFDAAADFPVGVYAGPEPGGSPKGRPHEVPKHFHFYAPGRFPHALQFCYLTLSKAMRAVVQRVRRARVDVDGTVVGEIGPGLLVLLGVGKNDTGADAEFLAEKILGLRIFSDDAGKMNRSVAETGGSLLIVSQFTLYGDVRKGRRPSFDLAAPPEQARALYEDFVSVARRSGLKVETGVFQAMMDVSLVNEGPVTLIVESVR
jgi:D-aminoacyl-tRNA deacylase